MDLIRGVSGYLTNVSGRHLGRLYVDISIAIPVLCQSRNQPIYWPSGVFLLVFLLLVIIALVVCWQCIGEPLVKYQWGTCISDQECISRQFALLVHFFNHLCIQEFFLCYKVPVKWHVVDIPCYKYRLRLIPDLSVTKSQAVFIL